MWAHLFINTHNNRPTWVNRARITIPRHGGGAWSMSINISHPLLVSTTQELQKNGCGNPLSARHDAVPQDFQRIAAKNIVLTVTEIQNPKYVV